MTECLSKGIPIVSIRTKTACTNCEKFADTISRSAYFLDFVKSKDNKCVIVEHSIGKQKLPEQLKVVGGTFTYVNMYWKDPSGIVHSAACEIAHQYYRSSP